MRWRLPIPRFRVVTLLGLVAVIAVGLGGYREFWSPKWVWRRAIHEETEQARSREHAFMYVVMNRVIEGMDRAETLAELERATKDRHAPIRELTIAEIWRLPFDSSDALRLIMAHLDDEASSVRAMAYRSLGDLSAKDGPAARRRAISLLLGRIDDPDPWALEMNLYSLHGLITDGHDGAEIEPDAAVREGLFRTIAGKLDDSNQTVQLKAACILACNGRGEGAVSMLIGVIRDSRSARFWEHGWFMDPGAHALLKLAGRSDPAAEFLMTQLYKEGEDFIYSGKLRGALVGIARADPDAHARIGRQANAALGSTDPVIRLEAAVLISQIGDGRPVIPFLIQAVASTLADLRFDAIGALKDLRVTNPAARQAIRAATFDNYPPVRRVALQALAVLDAVESNRVEDHEEGAR